MIFTYGLGLSPCFTAPSPTDLFIPISIWRSRFNITLAIRFWDLFASYTWKAKVGPRLLFDWRIVGTRGFVVGEILKEEEVFKACSLAVGVVMCR